MSLADIGPADPVRAVTAFDVASCDGASTLRDISKVMREEHCSLLLVFGEAGLSVVSERDIVHGLAADADPDHVWAVDVMSEATVTVTPDTSIERAAEVMLEAGVRHLVVEDTDADRVGVVSVRDLLDPLLAAGHEAAARLP